MQKDIHRAPRLGDVWINLETYTSWLISSSTLHSFLNPFNPNKMDNKRRSRRHLRQRAPIPQFECLEIFTIITEKKLCGYTCDLSLSLWAWFNYHSRSRKVQSRSTRLPHASNGNTITMLLRYWLGCINFRVMISPEYAFRHATPKKVRDSRPPRSPNHQSK